MHAQWTQRLQQEPQAYSGQLGEALFALSGKKLPPGVLDAALKNVEFTVDPLEETFQTMGQWAYDVGFAKEPAKLDRLDRHDVAPAGEGIGRGAAAASTRPSNPAITPRRRRRGANGSRGRLAIEHVDKNFSGSSVHALRDISLTCEPGEFVVVVGPSGCGKSTLLNVAAGMIKADRGSVTLDGKPVSTARAGPRDGLPGPRAVPVADGRAEHRIRPENGGNVAGPSGRIASPRRCRWST